MQDLRHASATAQGRRPYNEDRFHTSHPLPSPLNPHDPAPPSLFAVFDGHGGEACVDYVTAHLPSLIASHPLYLHPPSRAAALEAAFLTLDASLTSVTSIPPTPLPTPPPIGTSGTTAGTLLIDATHLHSANCGDTRTLLVPSPPHPPTALTTDHKPTDPIERARIEAAGGKVTVQEMTVARGGKKVVLVQSYVELGDAGLAVSRAFGDVGFKGVGGGGEGRGVDEQVVVVRPSVLVRARCADDEFLVMASDGLWNFVSDEVVVDFVRARLQSESDGERDVEDIACKLVQLALDKKSNDNVTVTLVVFPRGMQLRREQKLREEEKKNEA